MSTQRILFSQDQYDFISASFDAWLNQFPERERGVIASWILGTGYQTFAEWDGDALVEDLDRLTINHRPLNPEQANLSAEQ